MRIAVALGALLLTCRAAFASGGLDCGSAEERATMALHGGVTRGMGGPLYHADLRIGIGLLWMFSFARKLPAGAGRPTWKPWI
jgi:hypothetical protein